MKLKFEFRAFFIFAAVCALLLASAHASDKPKKLTPVEAEAIEAA